MPGGKPGLSFSSLFAFAWNLSDDTTPLAYASSAAGNDVTAPLTVIFLKGEQPVYTRDEIQVSDQSMQKVRGELDPNGTGDPVTGVELARMPIVCYSYRQARMCYEADNRDESVSNSTNAIRLPRIALGHLRIVRQSFSSEFGKKAN